MTKDDKWNEYFYEGTNVLKNNFNIRDEKILKQRECEVVAKKNVLLYLNCDLDNCKFDGNRLKNIHKFLFEDIYPFAGQFRNVNMGKDNRASFLEYEKIEETFNELLNNVDKSINLNSDFLYAESLANIYWNILDVIHPFREGNGRSAREFIRELVLSNNKKFDDVEYTFDFMLDKNNKDKLVQALMEPTRGNLVMMFYKMLKKKNVVKERILK